MGQYILFPDELPTNSDLNALLHHSALIIPSTHHEAARTLLRQQFYRPAEQKRPPLVKRAVYRLLHRSARFPPDEKIPASLLRRILILRYDGIGDYLLTTPLLQWLKYAVPHAEIDVLTSQRNDLLAAVDPHVCVHVPIYDRPQFHRSAARAYTVLSKRRYDLVFALVINNMTRKAFTARLLADNADYVTILNGRSAALYGQVFHRQVENHPWHQHWCETYYSAGPATVESEIPVETMPSLWVPSQPSAEESASMFLRSHGLQDEGSTTPERLAGQQYCVLNLSAHDQERSLAAPQALKTCTLLRERFPHYAVIIVSSPAHRTLGEYIAAQLGPPVYFYHKGFLEMIPLLRSARWVITPDTALVHVAAAQHVPVIGLYHRPLTVCEWYPYRTEFQIVLQCDPRGISAIAPEAILLAAEHMEAMLTEHKRLPQTT